ncbi:MAG: alkaline phosphatase D [Cyclobacteriaceae bacterium]|jgi:alkaline phosphatase D
MKYIALLLIMVSLESCVSNESPSSTFFLHGVASGDPLENNIILWTRITDTTANLNQMKLLWEMAEDDKFRNITNSGNIETSATRDFTVKVDVDGLKEGTVYFYRFNYKDNYSPTGRTKTISNTADSLEFAIVSCSNYEWGYFNAYGRIAQRPILDAVIHLGDYIYEYAPGTYGDTTLKRKHLPAKELISLQDYRSRYAQYRLDDDLQAVHASHPFITIWDDHEVANDVYKDGAQNHQSDEGLFNTRKNLATQAYYEWMPIRENQKHYRKFEYGALADLYMLDERLDGRTKPVPNTKDPTYQDTSRKMISDEQRSWLFENIKESSATWKIIGNQVIFSDLKQGMIFPNRPRNMDSWDGYPADKNRFAQFIKDENLKNIVFVTGDTHSSWALEVIAKAVSRVPIATEFGTPSINSANFDEYSTLDSAKMAESLYANMNNHIRYNNLTDHGYTLMTITNNKTTVRFYYVDTVKEPSQKERLGEKLWVFDGKPAIKRFSLY